MTGFDNEERWRKGPVKSDIMRQFLYVVPPLEMKATGEHEVFTPGEDDLPLLPLASEEEQLLMLPASIIPDLLPINPTVSLRGRAKKASSRLSESIEQGLTSTSIL